MDAGTFVSRPAIWGGGTCGPTPIKTDLACASCSCPPLLCSQQNSTHSISKPGTSKDACPKTVLYLSQRNQPQGAVKLWLVQRRAVSSHRIPDLNRKFGCGTVDKGHQSGPNTRCACLTVQTPETGWTVAAWSAERTPLLPHH